jgi:hypothetical protein
LFLGFDLFPMGWEFWLVLIVSLALVQAQTQDKRFEIQAGIANQQQRPNAEIKLEVAGLNSNERNIQWPGYGLQVTNLEFESKRFSK